MRWILRAIGHIAVIAFSATMGGLYVWRTQQQADASMKNETNQITNALLGVDQPSHIGSFSVNMNDLRTTSTIMQGSKSSVVNILPHNPPADLTSNRTMNHWLIDLPVGKSDSDTVPKLLSQPANHILPNTEKHMINSDRYAPPPHLRQRMMSSSKNAKVDDLPQMGEDAVRYLLSAPLLERLSQPLEDLIDVKQLPTASLHEQPSK